MTQLHLPTERPNALISNRIASLDGLRAISIIMVLVSHLFGTDGFPDIAPFFKGLDIGHLGVTIFFVISGLLITGLLFEEHRRTGRISLLLFYLRRTFRIFPAYYTFVAAVAIACSLGWVQLLRGDLAAALTYTMNYHSDPSWCLGHTWSLSVEEQFYLIWPFTLLVLGPRRGLVAAGTLVVAAPFIRFGIWQFAASIYPTTIVGSSFETTGDSIAIGCVLAGVRNWLWEMPGYRRQLQSPWFILVPVLALIMFRTGDHPRIYAVAHSVAIVCIALTIDRCIRVPLGFTGRILNSKVLVYIGGLSYSIYLWQQPFINRNVKTSFTSFPLNITLALIFAIFSYYIVEKPGLRLRKWVEAQLRDVRLVKTF